MAAETGLGAGDRGKTRSLFRVGLIWLGLLGLGWLWVDRMSPRAPICPPELREVRGVRLLYRHECGRCHSLDLPGMKGTMGPSLVGVGRRSTRAYLEESLREPGRRVVRGYVNGMPSYAQLPQTELDELVDYLKTL